MRRKHAIHLSALAAVLCLAAVMVSVGVAGTNAGPRPGRPAGPDPADFVPRITNPYLPFKPGAVWVYTGIRDGVTQRNIVRVADRTKTIMGVRCTVVIDVVKHRGRVLESTLDWYAQDHHGNVWYFGEATKAYENGQVDTSGSWLAGVNGARPGIVMSGSPGAGDSHRQEFLRDEAEDQYWLVDLHQQVRVPYGTFDDAALTLEWTRLEPGVIDRKYYVRGIGNVREVSAQGPHEEDNLIRFTPGR